MGRTSRNRAANRSGTGRKKKRLQLWPQAKRYTLVHEQPPGDHIVSTAAIKCLKEQYPSLLLGVRANHNEVFYNNPYLTHNNDPEGEEIQLQYSDGVTNSDKRPIHFMQAYCDDLGEKLNLTIKLTTNKPDLHLSDFEKTTRDVKKPYWLVNASHKNDYSIKKWRPEHWQTVVDMLRDRGILCVQVGNEAPFILKNAINFVGQTNLRQLFRLVYHSKGAITCESMLNHACAALERPAIVLCSGLFPLQWIAYPRSKLLGYGGLLPCTNAGGACWASNIALCKRPKGDFPECMELIEPAEVVRNVLAVERGREPLPLIAPRITN